LRRFYHGIDPNELTYQQYEALLDRMADIIDLESPNPDPRRAIERAQRRRLEGE
jgi:hypothetical protein